MVLTMSPKFGVVLPLLENVPGRSGIRIHTGTKPEHSKGCILVTPFGKKQITDFIHQNFFRSISILERINPPQFVNMYIKTAESASFFGCSYREETPKPGLTNPFNSV